MSKIKVERKPGKERLEELGVSSWPIWTKGSTATRIAVGLNFRPVAEKTKARQCFKRCGWNRVLHTRFENNQSSKFPWTYDDPETCYFLEGDVVVTPEGEEPVEVGQGDLVTFPQGMSCTWKIRKDVKKHYRFG